MENEIAALEEGNSPPAYELAEELDLTADVAFEVKRLQIFLTWRLRKRYGIRSNEVPAALKNSVDKCHYIRLGQLLDRYLDESWCSTGQHGRLVSLAEVNEYHAIRSKYLEIPAKIIGIPFSVVQEYVVMFMQDMTPWGYSPWHWTWYRFYAENLAHMLIIDRNVMIPALISMESRDLFLTKHRKLEKYHIDFLGDSGNFVLSDFGNLHWPRRPQANPRNFLGKGSPFCRLLVEIAVKVLARKEPYGGQEKTDWLPAHGIRPRGKLQSDRATSRGGRTESHRDATKVPDCLIAKYTCLSLH